MSSNDGIRPFRIDIPEESLQELRRRVAVPRWPDRETVSDRTQGAQLAKVQELVDYWATDYDWRKLEAKLNALPQFITEIDGLDIHFIHVRSPHANALPLIMTHGWPGSLPEADLAALDGEVGEVEGFGSLAGAPTTLNDAVVAPVPGSPAYRGRVVRYEMGEADHGMHFTGRQSTQSGLHYIMAGSRVGRR